MKLTFTLILFCLVLQPCTAQWMPSGNIVPSFYNSALAWEGKVYFAGGIPSIATGNALMQIFDVGTGQMTFKNLSAGRGGMMAVAHKGKLYFAGGYKWTNNGASYQMFSQIDVFNTVTGEFEPTLHLTVPRGAGIAAVLGDSLLFAGGYVFQNGQLFPSGLVEIFDTEAGEWKTSAQLSVARGDLGAATLNGKVYFCGGNTDLLTAVSTDRVDIFDGTNWTTHNLSVARGSLSVVSVGKYLLAAGGASNVEYKYNVVDVFNTETSQWSTADLSAPRCYMAAAVTSDKAYFTGGGNCNAVTFFLDQSTKVVDVFDAVTGQFQQIESLNTNRIAHACAAWEGKIVVGAGWRPEQNAFTGSVEVFTDPTWVSSTNVGRPDVDFLLYPNPTDNILNIEFPEEFPIGNATFFTILDLTGRACLSQQVNGQKETIDLTGFQPGLYLLKVIDEKGSRFKRIVLQ